MRPLVPKAMFILIVLVIITIIIDGTITGISASTGGLRSSIGDIAVFIGIVSVFAIAQYTMMRFVRIEYRSRQTRVEGANMSVRIVDKITSSAQYAILAILTYVILTIVFTLSYNIFAVIVCVIISYGLAFMLLTLLAKSFLSWFITTRNIVVLAYGLAITFISLNSLTAISYIWIELIDNPSEVIGSMRSPHGAFSSPGEGYGIVHTVTSFLAFVITWFATVLLLKHYSIKLGKMKYWTLVTIPLIYFLSQFQSLFLFTFVDFRLSDPILFGIVYNLIFSVSNTLGGILFGIALWTVSRSLDAEKVKRYLVLSSYGMVLLFTANQPSNIVVTPYPPFGLVTVCFLGLGAYLLYSGIYSSALSVSEDSRLRQSIRKIAFKESQQFLDLIGTAQMEQEIGKRVLKISRKAKETMEIETGIGVSLNDDDIKRYLEEVIRELKERQEHKG